MLCLFRELKPILAATEIVNETVGDFDLENRYKLSLA